MEGSGQLMKELMDEVIITINGFASIKDHQAWINSLRKKYEKELEDLLSKQLKYKQSKMDI